MPDPSWTLLVDVLLHRATARRAATEPAQDDSYDQLLLDAREAFTSALSGTSPFALVARRADLDLEEAEVLAALCAIELDPGRQHAVAALAGGSAPRRLDLAQVASLFGPDHRGPVALGPDATLVRAALVDVGTAPTWAARTAGPSARLSWFLMGDDSLDPGLPLGLQIIADEGDQRSDGTEHGVVLLAVGTDPTRQLQAALSQLPCRVALVADAPDDHDTWAALVREATITGAGIAVRAGESLPPLARWWIERTPHLEWAVVSTHELPLDGLPRRPWREVRADDPHARPDEVKAVFAEQAEEMADRRLTAQQLRTIVGASDGVGGPAAAVRRLAAGQIERLARRVRPRVGWDDLVLPEDQLAQLRELSARYRHRNIVHGSWGAAEFPSPGVIALFAGPSGTGKTTAAEVIAADLGVDLFKVEVSSVVSKYIGETEQNLERLFEAAESGDMVLCFDEADALLGKRSEVSDARDRYANLEVSYLLQRLETYEGLVVMTTNLQSNIDDAFLRRMHARISFAPPGPADRRRIWDRALLGIPTEDLDLDAVAERLDLVGGSIRNAAMNAAFVAADRGTAVTMEVLLHGLKRELQKHNRLITRELLGDWYEVVS